MNLRHISRFTYEFTSFQGWRVAISRQGASLARYFSDKQYGSPEAACEQAIRFRDMVLDELQRDPIHTRDILHKHRLKPRILYPEEAAAQEPVPASLSPTCAIRAIYRDGRSDNSRLYDMLRKMCQHLQLDLSGVLKLSLYLFTFQYGTVTAMTSDRKTGTEWHADASLSPPKQAPPEWDDFMQLVTNDKPARHASLHDPQGTTGRQMQSQCESGNMRPPRPSPPESPICHTAQHPTTSPPLYFGENTTSAHPPTPI